MSPLAREQGQRADTAAGAGCPSEHRGPRPSRGVALYPPGRSGWDEGVVCQMRD